MQKLSSLCGIDDLTQRCKEKRRIEGMLHYVLINGGNFTEQEAEKIVDAYMICREISDPNHHPLQTSVVSGKQYNSRASVYNTTIFSHATVKRELNKKGFYLNVGPLSSAESLLLMKNFEENHKIY